MAHWSIQKTLASSKLPISLDEVKVFLRLDGCAEDSLITMLAQAAVAEAEILTGRQLTPATYTYKLDQFPVLTLPVYSGLGFTGGRIPEVKSLNIYPNRDDIIRLPFPPLNSVTSITYIDTSNITQTVDPSIYLVDTASTPGRIAPDFAQVWPVARNIMGAVSIVFSAGYADGRLPPALKLAVLQLITHWYMNRESVAPGHVREIPLNVSYLLRNWWVAEYR